MGEVRIGAGTADTYIGPNLGEQPGNYSTPQWPASLTCPTRMSRLHFFPTSISSRDSIHGIFRSLVPLSTRLFHSLPLATLHSCPHWRHEADSSFHSGECASHFRQILQRFPPQVKTRSSAAAWACHVHNEVNKSLKKALFDCSRIGDFYDCGCAEDEEERKASTEKEVSFHNESKFGVECA